MEYAIIFLISFCTKATVAAKNAVIIPTKVIIFNVNWEYSKIGEHLTTKKTPAVTIVAAWINAETGVGPSIASGSQVCNNICADLPIAPIKRSKQIKSIELSWSPKIVNLLFKFCGICWNTSL